MRVTGFSVDVDRGERGVTILQLAGELDLAGTPIMRQVGLAALDQPNCTALVLDVNALTFIDSTGIGSWVEMRNHARQSGRALTLRGASDELTRVLTIAGLASFLGIDGESDDGQRA